MHLRSRHHISSPETSLGVLKTVSKKINFLLADNGLAYLTRFCKVIIERKVLSFSKSSDGTSILIIMRFTCTFTFREVAFLICGEEITYSPFHFPLYKHNWISIKKSRLLYSSPPAIFFIHCSIKLFFQSIEIF